MSTHNFTWGHLMKIGRLVADARSVGSPDRAEHDLLGVILSVFLPIQATFVVRETFCDVGILS